MTVTVTFNLDGEDIEDPSNNDIIIGTVQLLTSAVYNGASAGMMVMHACMEVSESWLTFGATHSMTREAHLSGIHVFPPAHNQTCNSKTGLFTVFDVLPLELALKSDFGILEIYTQVDDVITILHTGA